MDSPPRHQNGFTMRSGVLVSRPRCAPTSPNSRAGSLPPLALPLDSGWSALQLFMHSHARAIALEHRTNFTAINSRCLAVRACRIIDHHPSPPRHQNAFTIRSGVLVSRPLWTRGPARILPSAPCYPSSCRSNQAGLRFHSCSRTGQLFAAGHLWVLSGSQVRQCERMACRLREWAAHCTAPLRLSRYCSNGCAALFAPCGFCAPPGQCSLRRMRLVRISRSAELSLRR